MRIFTAIRTFATSAAQKEWLDAVTKFAVTEGGSVHHARIGAMKHKPPIQKGWIKILQDHPDRFRVEPRSTVPGHGYTVTVVGSTSVVKNAMDNETVPPKNSDHKLEPQCIDSQEDLDAFVNLMQKDSSSTNEKRYMGLDVRLNHGVFHSIIAFISDRQFTFDCAKIPRTSVLAAFGRINVIALIHDVTKAHGVWNDKLINMPKVIDTQFLGELAFGEPFLTEKQLMKHLQTSYSGDEIMQQHGRDIDWSFFFRLVQQEIQKSLDVKEVDWLVEASKRRLESQESNKICFDPATRYAMRSALLVRTTRNVPTDTFFGAPLVEKNDIGTALNVLPEGLKSALGSNSLNKITEIVLDVGRQPQYWTGEKRNFFHDDTSVLVSQSDVDHVVGHLGPLGTDNRASLPQQLHRFSVMKDRKRNNAGVTIRIGRHIEGISDLLLDLLKGTNESILILGEPSSGKTTIIRDIARRLAEENNVVIVDTSNEIGGAGSIPHHCIGLARRMMVPALDRQGAIMVECVQNHTPHVMVIDEIGRKREAEAARTVKQRGVRMVASAHGDLSSIVENRELHKLVGGVEQVMLGDEMASRMSARRRQALSPTKKSVFTKLKSQRAETPTFGVIVELSRGDRYTWRVVTDVAQAVDALLDGLPYEAQLRSRDPKTGELSLSRDSVSGAGFSIDGTNAYPREHRGTRPIIDIQSPPATQTDALGPTCEPGDESPSIFVAGKRCHVVQDCETLVTTLRTDPAFERNNSRRQFVALDCEGVPDNLHLLQLATQHGVYVVDCLKIGPRQVCNILQPLLLAENIIKLMHDVKCDAQAFYRYGRVSSVCGVLDTQLVAQKLFLHTARGLGLNGFLEKLGLPLHSSKHLARSFDGGDQFWSERPIPRAFLEYAAEDVVCLLRAAEEIESRLSSQELSELIKLSEERAKDAALFEQEFDVF